MIQPTSTYKEKVEIPLGVQNVSLRSGSEYFPVNRPESSMWCDSGFFGETYHISTRSNIKNYGFEIDTFLEWIEPYIAGGSGNRGMFAIVIEEDASEPDIYYLDDYRDYK